MRYAQNKGVGPRGFFKRLFSSWGNKQKALARTAGDVVPPSSLSIPEEQEVDTLSDTVKEQSSAPLEPSPPAPAAPAPPAPSAEPLGNNFMEDFSAPRMFGGFTFVGGPDSGEEKEESDEEKWL